MAFAKQKELLLRFAVTRSRRRESRQGGRDEEFAMNATWAPHEKHWELTAKGDLPDTVFAFPKQRKEPMTDAKHVRNAVARFDQVTDVSDEDRALAFTNIKKAAEHYDVELTETSWRDLGVHPQAHRKEAAAKAVKAKRERGTIKKAAGKATATRKR
jgi:hypothetical protein